MEVVIVPVLIVCTLSAILYVLKLTFLVSINNPGFAARAFVFGLASSAVGFLAEGRVEVKLVLWGAGGLVVYVAYKYVFDQS